MNVAIKVLLWIVYLLSLYFGIFWFLVFLERQEQVKPKSRRKPSVSVIVPCFNEEKTLELTVKSVVGLNYSKAEVIIVDDGSTDGTRKVAERLIRKYQIPMKYVWQSNKGKGAALNAGLREAKGEIFVCLDADSMVEADGLKNMLPYFDDEKVAAVLPVVKVRKPKSLLQKMQWYEYNINTFYKELMSTLDCVHVAPGPFSAYKTDVLRKLGGFDEKDNLTEDLEMALRLQSKHYKLVQLLDTDVATIAPKNLKQLYKQRNRWYKGAVLNALRYRKMFFNKEYGDFGMIQMPSIILAGVIAIVLIASMAWYGLEPYVTGLWNMQFIGWDWWTMLKSITFDFNWRDLNYMALLFGGFMLAISLYVLKKSHTYTREKTRYFGILPLFVYMLVYYVVIAAMWIGILFDLVLGRRQKW